MLTCRLQVCGESHVGKFARCWPRQWEYFGLCCRPAAWLHSRLHGICAALAARGWAVSSGSNWTNFLGRSRAPDRPRSEAQLGFVPHPGAASVVWVLVRRCLQITPISGPKSLPIMEAKLFDDTQNGYLDTTERLPPRIRTFTCVIGRPRNRYRCPSCSAHHLWLISGP